VKFRGRSVVEKCGACCCLYCLLCHSGLCELLFKCFGAVCFDFLKLVLKYLVLHSSDLEGNKEGKRTGRK
jgi:hypothetical protein